MVNNQLVQCAKAIRYPVTLCPNLFNIAPTIKLVKAAVRHIIPVNQDAASFVIGSLPTGGFSLCSCGIVGDCQPIIVPNAKDEMFAEKKIIKKHFVTFVYHGNFPPFIPSTLIFIRATTHRLTQREAAETSLARRFHFSSFFPSLLRFYPICFTHIFPSRSIFPKFFFFQTNEVRVSPSVCLIRVKSQTLENFVFPSDLSNKRRAIFLSPKLRSFVQFIPIGNHLITISMRSRI